jgi:hypothetical protein
VFSAHPEGVEAVRNYLQSLNIKIKEEKSGYVKYEGQWKNPLKFCGLEYNGSTGRIRAATRRGSTMEFDDISMFLSYLLHCRNEIVYGGSASHLNQKIERYEGMSPKD